jgi:copper resistance protein B
MMSMPMPTPTPPANPSPPGGSGGGQTKTLPNLSKNFPPPVSDNERYGSFLFDVLEFRPGRGGDSDFRWDIEGWYGTDYNRFFIKSEGERNTAFKADYDIDLQLLYSRLISPYFNFQAGVRFETQTFRGANVTRPQAVVGFEGLAPYFIELESGVFIDPKGNVSGRLSLTKDFLFTNRLIMQARFETNAAIQQVERFTTGRGLNNIEAGFRFRYEFRRRFAPYVGVSFDRSFFGTARLVRQDGGDPKQIRFVTGVRMFF